MAHEIEIRDGKASMMYVGETPWHGLGVPLVDPPTVEEGIRLAGLDWSVETRPLFLGDGREVEAQATVRTVDNKVLGVVGPDYTVLQNSKAFAFFQPFVEQGLVSLETAGSLRGGSRIWVLGRIKADPADIVAGDPVRAYILLWNSHDGTLACGTGFSAIRTVCANTLAQAMRDEASRLIRLKHTSNIEQALEAVRNAMDVSSRQFQASVEQYRDLARKGCNASDLEKYVKLVFAPKAKSKATAIVVEAGDEAEEDTTCKRILPRIVNLFENGKGSNIPGVKGTYWGAYNAVTEYLGYERGTDADRRLDNLWFGQGANLSKKALEVALAA